MSSLITEKSELCKSKIPSFHSAYVESPQNAIAMLCYALLISCSAALKYIPEYHGRSSIFESALRPAIIPLLKLYLLGAIKILV